MSTAALLLLALLLPSSGAPSAGREARIRALQERLLAPCCYSESVARHRSETALRMQTEIARFVDTGRTDREILDHYKREYGARVLMEPEGASFWFVSVTPWIAVLIGFVLTIWAIRRMLAAKPERLA